MIRELLRKIERSRTRSQTQSLRDRVRLDCEPVLTYAVGDVHGCLALLKQLEAEIQDDARATEGEKWIVMLGDYVDRGPASAQVLDHLIAHPPEGFRRICLAGNHELDMSDFLSGPTKQHQWLDFGGLETLMSYGISRARIAAASRRGLAALVASHVPHEHQQFLQQLPVMLATPQHLFVHGGIVPQKPIAQQTDHDLVWFRDDLRESYESLGKIVVHGHQPGTNVHISKHRICVDTGAYLTGKLSAIRLSRAERPGTLEVSAASLNERAGDMRQSRSAIEKAPN